MGRPQFVRQQLLQGGVYGKRASGLTESLVRAYEEPRGRLVVGVGCRRRLCHGPRLAEHANGERPACERMPQASNQNHQLTARRLCPVRVRFVGQRDVASKRILGTRGGGHREPRFARREATLGLLHQDRRRVQVDDDLRWPTQPVTLPAAHDDSPAELLTQPADQSCDIIRRMRRRPLRPQDLNHPAGWHDAAAFHRQQLQQLTGLEAAQPDANNREPVPDHSEHAGQPDLELGSGVPRVVRCSHSQQYPHPACSGCARRRSARGTAGLYVAHPPHGDRPALTGMSERRTR
jgi:hypothetical protein